MDSRKTRRIGKRIMARFGAEEPDRAGYTYNLSPQGMFIATSSPLPRNSQVMVQLDTPRTPLVVKGVVRWQRDSRTRATAGPSGMGVFIPSPPAEYDAISARRT